MQLTDLTLTPTPQLNEALAQAKKEFPKILQNKKVSIKTKAGYEYSFTYAELEEILDTCTPALSDFGLALSSSMGYSAQIFGLLTTLRHTSGETIASFFPFPDNLMIASDPKEIGIRISYARRYNTLILLEISTVEPSNETQREEKVRKVARDVKRESDRLAEIDKREQNKMQQQPQVKPVVSSKPSQQPQDPSLFNVHNNKIINELLAQLNIANDRFNNWFVRKFPNMAADELDQEQMLEVIRRVCSVYASDRGNANAEKNVESAVITRLNIGFPLHECVNYWLTSYFSPALVPTNSSK